MGIEDDYRNVSEINVEKLWEELAPRVDDDYAVMTSIRRHGVTLNHVVSRIIERLAFTGNPEYFSEPTGKYLEKTHPSRCCVYNVANLDVAIKAVDMAIDDVREAKGDFMAGDLLGMRWTLALNLLQVDGVNGHPALDWDRLLSDETGSRGHDVWGVNRYLDPLTGELRECFSPRFHVLLSGKSLINGRGRDE